MENIIKNKLLLWYRKNHRKLPWRKLYKNRLPNPYYIFISEYMLQQTTVSTVKNRFSEFINLWPNVKLLAKISRSRILNFWSGLGYYSRAKNLLLASKIIHTKYKDKIPDNYEDLISLPGIGDYTAKAILGIAYNKPVLPLDANIERILARLHCIKQPLIKNKNKLKKIASFYISKKSSTNLIQAFMDYGSLICLPRIPICDKCVIREHCKANRENVQNLIPFKPKKRSKKLIKYSRAYVLSNEKNEIIIRKRLGIGMLASMIEVPNDPWVNKKTKLRSDKIIKKIQKKLLLKGKIRYSFSHFDLYVDVFFAKIVKKNYSNVMWLSKNKIYSSGMPTAMKKIVEKGLV